MKMNCTKNIVLKIIVLKIIVLKTMDYKLVKQMLNTLDGIKSELLYLENMINREKERLQGQCEHDFYKTLEPDCHSSSWCYTCTKCDYWTFMKPSS